MRVLYSVVDDTYLCAGSYHFLLVISCLNCSAFLVGCRTLLEQWRMPTLDSATIDHMTFFRAKSLVTCTVRYWYNNSVRPTHAGIVPNRLKASSIFFHRLIAPTILVLSRTNHCYEMLAGSCTWWPKKVSRKLFSIYSPNIDRFSKIFNRHNYSVGNL